jgi:hypothetical protein
MGEAVRRQRVRSALLALSFVLFPLTINYFSPIVVLGSAITRRNGRIQDSPIQKET